MNIIEKNTSKDLEIANNNLDIKDENHEKINYKNKVCVKPWGYEHLIFENDKISIWYINLNRGHQTSMHCHFNKDTQLIILKGTAKISTINDKYCLNEMSSIFLPCYKFHQISSFSEELILLEIEIFSNNVNFSDKNDLLRIDDVYKRQNKGYESSVEVLTSDEELSEYSYFYLNGKMNKNVKTVDFNLHEITDKNSHLLNALEKNNYNILLSGTVFKNNEYIKEGSILNNFSKNYIINNDCKILSLNNIDYINNSKIVYDNEQLEIIVNKIKKINKSIILTSGCFDIIHSGHMNTLHNAKKLGDILIVCISSDEQIKKLKGDSRPINNYKSRIDLLKTINYIDYVVLYNEVDIINETSLGKIMKIINPEHWVKGSDYDKKDILNKHPYLKNITIIPNIENISTTILQKKIETF